jgi:hypothetical protein
MPKADTAFQEISETLLMYEAVTYYNLAACHQRNINSSLQANYTLCDKYLT